MKKKTGVEYYKTPAGRWAWVYRGLAGVKLARSAQAFSSKDKAKRSFMSVGRNMLRIGAGSANS